MAAYVLFEIEVQDAAAFDRYRGGVSMPGPMAASAARQGRAADPGVDR